MAAFRLTPVTIGVGYDFGRLPTIFPQAHDVPLDAVVTESGRMRFGKSLTSGKRVSYPPCYLHELDDKNSQS